MGWPGGDGDGVVTAGLLTPTTGVWPQLAREAEFRAFRRAAYGATRAFVFYTRTGQAARLPPECRR